MNWSSQTWGQTIDSVGTVLGQVDEGTTSGPSKSTALWEPVPEMSTVITPSGSKIEIRFESNALLSPVGAGSLVQGQVRISIDGVPVPGTTRSLRFCEVDIAGLIAPSDHNEVISVSRPVSVTPGQEITITAEWSVSSGSITLVDTERSLLVKEGAE